MKLTTLKLKILLKKKIYLIKNRNLKNRKFKIINNIFQKLTVKVVINKIVIIFKMTC